MKKIAIILLLAAALLCMPASALANGLGVSPVNAELEIPTDGSATQDFTIYGFEGTIDIGLENVPLVYSPTSIDVTDGETITVTFYGDGTNNTYEGKITFLANLGGQIAAGIKIKLTVHVNCTVEVVAPSPPPTGGGPIYITTKTDCCGVVGYFSVDQSGRVIRTVTAGCKEGDLVVTIERDTIALDGDGEPLRLLSIHEDTDPPPLPEGDSFIGLPFKLEPSGATFDPPITFIWSYDPVDFPEGVAWLVIAYYDEGTGEWVELPCTVDPVTHTITASVAHFTTFAIIGTVPPVPPPPPVPAAFSVSSLSVLPAEVEPGETVTIAVSVANTGGTEGSFNVILKIDGVKEAEERVTIAAHSSQEVSFSVAKEEAGSYTVDVDGLTGTFTVVAPVAPAAFSVSNLTVQPAEVKPNERVTISVSVANTGGTEGSYNVVLLINDVKEAEKSVTIAAGRYAIPTFSVTREEAGNYTVEADGLSGSFTVLTPVTPPGFNWPLIGGIIAAVVVVALLVYFLWYRRRAY